MEPADLVDVLFGALTSEIGGKKRKKKKKKKGRKGKNARRKAKRRAKEKAATPTDDKEDSDVSDQDDTEVSPTDESPDDDISDENDEDEDIPAAPRRKRKLPQVATVAGEVNPMTQYMKEEIEHPGLLDALEDFDFEHEDSNEVDF